MTGVLTDRSIAPAERDLVEHSRAEFFRGPRHRLAAQRAIELDRVFVFRQRPHDQRFQRALRQVAPRRREQAAAKAQALVFRPQVKLVDFAVVIEAARAVAAVIGVACDLIAELQQRDAAALADRAVPPRRAAAVDESPELGARNYSLIGRPPCLIMRVGNRGGIARLGAAYFDEDGAHDAKLMMRFSIRLSILFGRSNLAGRPPARILRSRLRYRLLAKRHGPCQNCKQENAALPRNPAALLQ